MSKPPLTDDLAVEAAITYRACGDNLSEAARTLGLARQTFQNRLKRAAERGLLGPQETLPGYRIESLTQTPNGT